MPVDLKIIGGKILTASDLERMNEEEVKNRDFTHCMVDCGDNGAFLAEVGYSELSKAWAPTRVKMKGGYWVDIDEFKSLVTTEYSCENYRKI